ncbi:MAG: hypothetical protein NTY56_02615 [Patescibacteria group bacterium]|nr:hypothetical protein [Patescibacteria group bacterium]
MFLATAVQGSTIVLNRRIIMSKKKKHKHKLKKSNNNIKVVNKSTLNVTKGPTIEDKEILTPTKDKNYVISDVKYSLVLMATIIACFLVLSLILSNKSISDQVYSIFKINL